MVKVEYSEAKVESLIPNTWNPNEMPERVYNHLKKEIMRIGFVVPIIVRKANMMIIDGEHRWNIAKELAMESVLLLA